MNKLFYIALVSILFLAGYLRWQFVQDVPLGFDEIWHVFIARQASWADFWQQLHDTVHPPLYFLCLKFFSNFFHEAISFRYLNICLYFFWLFVMLGIARLLNFKPFATIFLIIISAFSFGAFPLSIAIRGYMLSVLLGTSAYYYFLRYQISGQQRSLILMCLLGISACLTHLSQTIFILALCVLFLFKNIHLYWFTKKFSFPEILAVCSFLCGCLILKYAFLVSDNLNLLDDYLYKFYYQGDFASFFWTNLNNFLNFIYPERFVGTQISIALCIIASLSLLSAIIGKTIRQERVWLILVIMLLINCGLAIIQKYPFGGDLRHTLYALPFMLIVTAQALDRLLSSASIKMQSLIFCLTGVLLIPFTLKNITFFELSAKHYYQTDFWLPSVPEVEITDPNKIYYLSGLSFLPNLVKNNLLDNYQVTILQRTADYYVYRFQSNQTSFLLIQENDFINPAFKSQKIYQDLAHLHTNYPNYQGVKIMQTYLVRPIIADCLTKRADYASGLQQIIQPLTSNCQFNLSCEENYSLLNCEFNK